MFGPHRAGNAIKYVIVGQNGAQQLLFGLNVLGHRFQIIQAIGCAAQGGRFVHGHPFDRAMYARSNAVVQIV